MELWGITVKGSDLGAVAIILAPIIFTTVAGMLAMGLERIFFVTLGIIGLAMAAGLVVEVVQRW